uniref:Uncharacterized protein n=1 Tax=Hyaloperonospora arabidopsidis (strain Emoy2) TaxID=559515 RepID=M4BNR3_HYAAE
MRTIAEQQTFRLEWCLFPMSWVELVVEQHLIADAVIHYQRTGTRTRQEVHAPSGRRNSSREVHLTKGVVDGLATNQKQALKNYVGVRVRVHVGDVDEVLATKHIKFLERVGATQNVHLRALKSETGFFRLHLNVEIASRQLRDLANLMDPVEVLKRVISVVFTSEGHHDLLERSLRECPPRGDHHVLISTRKSIRSCLVDAGSYERPITTSGLLALDPLDVTSERLGSLHPTTRSVSLGVVATKMFLLTKHVSHRRTRTSARTRRSGCGGGRWLVHRNVISR